MCTRPYVVRLQDVQLDQYFDQIARSQSVGMAVHISTLIFLHSFNVYVSSLDMAKSQNSTQRFAQKLRREHKCAVRRNQIQEREQLTAQYFASVRTTGAQVG